MSCRRHAAVWRRRARWAVAAPTLIAVVACTDRSLQKPVGPPENELVMHFLQNQSRDIDIVFLVDDSSSMKTVQKNLTNNFPTFMNVLKSVPGGLPDVHIGVVSSSLGAGAFSDVPGCPPGGARGAFQNTPRAKEGHCTAVPRDHYIISTEKGTKNNFDGDIADVFSCIAELGDTGCGFEHQLAAVKRALGGDSTGAPPENAGFLRDDAILAVVFITNEDDCSAPPDSDLFDTRQNSLSDPLGPLNSFRCNEFGHLCGGARPPRTPADNLQGCEPAEGAGKLTPVAEYVKFFKGLKRNPEKVMVAAIAAPATPYSVIVSGAGAPAVAPSCTSSDAFGDPAVRLKAFVDAFGRNGSFTSICTDNLGPALDTIARKISVVSQAACIDGPLLDTDPARDGVQPSCSVVDASLNGDTVVETPLASCEDGAPPCYRLAPNNRDCTASGQEFQIDRGGSLPPPDTIAEVRCLGCADGSDPRCR